MAREEIEKEINEQIITALQAHTIPWRSDSGFPRHIITRRRYAGLNAILMMSQGFKSPYWGTLRDWEMVGGKVNSGPSTYVVAGGSLSRCQVYNLDQVNGAFNRGKQFGPDWERIHRIIANTKATIRFTHKAVAFYHFPWEGDYIEIPFRKQFERGQGGIGGFFNVLFHELAHWSEPRLHWAGPKDVQELRAELVADFLTTELAIPELSYHTRLNIHKHIDKWVERMRKDPKMIFEVVAAADKAVDFILSFTSAVEPRHEVGEEAAA